MSQDNCRIRAHIVNAGEEIGMSFVGYECVIYASVTGLLLLYSEQSMISSEQSSTSITGRHLRGKDEIVEGLEVVVETGGWW